MSVKPGEINGDVSSFFNLLHFHSLQTEIHLSYGDP